MVGYFQDVIGTSNHNVDKQQQQQQVSHHKRQYNVVQSGSSTLLATVANGAHVHSVSDIKEQIEWLHYEHINLLIPNQTCSPNLLNNPQTNSASSFTNYFNSNKKTPHLNLSNSNILLIIGYKTGFSIWTIDVRHKF
jgi:hypothetical protein